MTKQVKYQGKVYDVVDKDGVPGIVVMSDEGVSTFVQLSSIMESSAGTPPAGVAAGTSMFEKKKTPEEEEAEAGAQKPLSDVEKLKAADVGLAKKVNDLMIDESPYTKAIATMMMAAFGSDLEVAWTTFDDMVEVFKTLDAGKEQRKKELEEQKKAEAAAAAQAEAEAAQKAKEAEAEKAKVGAEGAAVAVAEEAVVEKPVV